MSALTWILITGAGACAFLFIYPYIVYPALLCLLPRVRRHAKTAPADSPSARVALLFCAYNEEEALPAKIQNLRLIKQEVPELEILAYSDCSTDRTNELLSDAEDILTPVLGTSRTGKPSGMRKLVDLTTADILVFTDANVHIRPGSLRRLIEYFSNPTIGSVSATLVYDDDSNTDLGETARVGGLYWKMEEFIKTMETRTGSMMGADGACFACRRSGYPHVPAHLVDDLMVSINVIFNGQRCISADDVIAAESSVTSRAEELRRKRRIACGSYSTYRHLKEQLDSMSLLNRFKFFSHKVVRWWGGFLLLGAGALGCGALLSAGFGAAGLLAVVFLCIGFALMARLDVPVVAPIAEILLAIFATGIGILESIGGKKYQVWNPAKTR